MTKVKRIQQLEERLQKERARARFYIREAETVKAAAVQQMALTDAILSEIAHKYGEVEIPKPQIGRYQVAVEQLEDGYKISCL